MKVGIIGLNPEKVSTGYVGGIDSYAKSLYEGLENRGIEVECIWTGYPRTPLSKTIHSFIPMTKETLQSAKDFDLIHAVQPGFSLAFPFIKDTPKVVTMHDMIPKNMPNTINPPKGLRNRLFNLFNYFVFSSWLIGAKRADKIIAVSSQTEKELIDSGFKASKIDVVHEFVPSKFRKLEEVESDEKLVGYLGPVTYRKNIHYAIEVFEEMAKRDDELKFQICGKIDKKDYLNYLKKLIKEKNLEDKVSIEGFIPEDEIVEKYNSFGVMLFPTFAEGFGLPILEALKCGTPVVVREDSLIPKEIKSLCNSGGSKEEIAEIALKKLKEEIPKEMIKNLTKKFSKNKMIDKTIETYNEVCEIN
ncbi:hypothetical protein C9439_03850 [archaeon SCG-AAA382B04]|nr:hypothetical protein C9439_03850 [archaeon SCG-AAA382B04]